MLMRLLTISAFDVGERRLPGGGVRLSLPDWLSADPIRVAKCVNLDVALPSEGKADGHGEAMG